MANSNRRDRWKKAGLCSMCGQRPPTKDGKACEECKRYYREYRAKLRANGVCKCGREPVDGGRTCDLCRAKSREHNRDIKHKCFMAYGGYQCACCGDKTPEFLQLDHINNDGAEHRKIIGKGNSTYWWLIKNNFPPGFQILCANCNYAKANYGRCPHQPDKEVNDEPRQNSDQLERLKHGRGYLADKQAGRVSYG